MSKVLFISPPILNGSGGEVIRKRNKNFLEEYVGKENLFHFYLDYYALYDNSRNEQIENSLKKLIEQFKPDLIYMDNSLMKVPNFVFDYKTMVFFHNVEAKYASQDSRLNKELINLISENEKTIINKTNYLVCINERDSNELKTYYGRGSDYILPISFNDQYQAISNNKNGDYLLFVGSDFFGNTDGLFWFIENCLTDINQSLIVVGKGMEKYNAKYIDKKVTFLGFVENLDILYANASCVVLPIISGSGMKTKTCEALMYGKKCFGTIEAFEGYQNIDEADVSICENADDFVNNINNYLTDNNLIYFDKPRKYYLTYYENEIVKTKYHQFLNEKVKI